MKIKISTSKTGRKVAKLQDKDGEKFSVIGYKQAMWLIEEKKAKLID